MEYLHTRNIYDKTYHKRDYTGRCNARPKNLDERRWQNKRVKVEKAPIIDLTDLGFKIKSNEKNSKLIQNLGAFLLSVASIYSILKIKIPIQLIPNACTTSNLY